MNAQGWSTEFQQRQPITHAHIHDKDNCLTLSEDCDSIIIPLRSVTLAAFPGTGPTQVGAGSLLFVPAGTCRTVEFSGECNAIMISITPVLRRVFEVDHASCQLSVGPNVQLVKSPQQIQAIVLMMQRLAEAMHPFSGPAMLSLVQLLLLEIALCTQQSAPAIPRQGRTLPAKKLAALDRFIDENLEDALNLQQLAEQAGMSRFYFLRAFKQTTGSSPLQYILARRVAKARQMLAIGKEPIAEVAYATGFSSQSHLNWAFKRHYGVTPGAFRRRHA